jgi:hypothetical protein
MRLADVIQTTQTGRFSADIPEGFVAFIERVNTVEFNPPYLAKQRIELEPSESFFLIKIDGELIPENVPVSEEIICDGLCFRDKPNSLSLEALPIIPLENTNALLADIRDTLQNQQPIGEVYDMTVDLTGNTVYTLDKTDNGDELDWASCTIINKGPGNLYVSVNKWVRPKDPLGVGDTMPINMGQRGAIKKIFLVSEANQTTTVKIQAMR